MRRSLRFLGMENDDREPVLPIYQPAAATPVAGPLMYGAVFQNLTGAPMDRFDRWANRIEYPTGRLAAKTTAWATKSIPVFMVSAAFWVVLYFAGAFNHASIDPVSVLAFTMMSSFVVSAALWLARGSQQPNYGGFEHYMAKLAAIPDLLPYVTQPDFNNHLDARNFVQWHSDFLTYIVGGGSAQGVVEATLHIFTSMQQHFSKFFEIPEEASDDSEDEESGRVTVGDQYGIRLLDDPAVSVQQGDHFVSAPIEEKRLAAQSDWRALHVFPEKRPFTTDDFIPRLMSHVSASCIYDSAQLASSAGQAKSVSVLTGLLQALVTDPMTLRQPGERRFLKKAIADKSFQLVNLLRPAIHDGQWNNWRYWYANDSTVSKAFANLSTQQQVWMIYTLMSGSDHGKLLALSIVQDPAFSTSALATFFKAYSKEFGGISWDRSKALYREVHGETPNKRQNREFRISMVNDFRVQLACLTDNSTGRIKSLFEKDPALAAQVLLNFTVDLDSLPKEVIENTYAKAADVVLGEEHRFMNHDIGDSIVRYAVRPDKHDGGFSVFSSELRRIVAGQLKEADTSFIGPLHSDFVMARREGIVEAVLSMMTSDDPVFQEQRSEDSVELNAREYIAYEIMELLSCQEYRAMIPRVFVEGRLSKGLRIVTRLEHAEAAMKRLYDSCLAKAPRRRRYKIKNISELIDYYEDDKNSLNDIADVERSTVSESLRGTMQDRTRFQKEVYEFCQRSDVITAYLKQGVGHHLPLGARTAALFAVSSGYQVNGFVVADESLQKVMRNDSASHEIFSMVMGKRWDRWRKLQVSFPRAEPIAPFRRPGQSDSKDDPVRRDRAREDDSNQSSHPFVVHAQALFWAVQSKEIADEMEVGHRHRGTKGYEGFSRLLYAIAAPQNIAAIKKGVLQSGSLKALLPILDNSSTRRSAFIILAELFSDPAYGIYYERSFRKLVEAHRSKFCDDARIAEFLAFLAKLNDRSPGRINPDMVRARFAAVILMETLNQKQLRASKRSARVEKLIRVFYPHVDLLTALERMRPAFSGHAEWETRRKICRLIVTTHMNRDDLRNNDGLAFLLAEPAGFRDMFDVIRANFSGDIMSDLEAFNKVTSWGDLLGNIITEFYWVRPKYIENVLEKLCEIIAGRRTDTDASRYLMLVLVNALYHIETPDEEDDTKRLSLMHRVLFAFFKRSDLGVHKDLAPRLNTLLSQLGAERYKTSKRTDSETVPLTIEVIYSLVAAFICRNDREGFDTANNMAEAQALIGDVVMNPSIYTTLMTGYRVYLGRYLATLIDEGEYLSEAAHQEMVHRALYLVLSDTHIFHLKSDAERISSEFHNMCSKAGMSVDAPDLAVGLQNLLTGVGDNLFLQGHFQAELRPVMCRMVVLLFCEMYKKIPSSHRMMSDLAGVPLQRENAVQTMRTILEALPMTDNARDNQKISDVFSSRSDLHTAFIELGMGSMTKTICNLIKGANNQAAAEGEDDIVSVEPARRKGRKSNGYPSKRYTRIQNEDSDSDSDPDERTALRLKPYVPSYGSGRTNSE